ncbi:MAG TPA: glutaminyl-peptide cyclotransferase [Pyrinomonadaceae bacterium]|nr:glutaminyl-peptide cyclotransferase [Pyrinomonadaceae bacterium]
MRLFLITIACFLAFGCSANAVNNGTNAASPTPVKKNVGPAPVYGFEIVKTYPHDPKAFTEGLYFKDGFLYESTGEKGESSLRKVELETGKVVQKWDLPREDFGEGIAEVNGKIYQLTYQQGLCRQFDAADFKLLKEFHYPGEGWGMTTDGSLLYMTDGTHVIRVMDPETFKSKRMIVVKRDDGEPQMRLNELEWVKGELWANVWHSEDPEVLGKPNYIARIDPNSGAIVGWIDLAGISPDDQARSNNPNDAKAENTLNGIAYDAAGDRIFVTGKDWKNLYEIRLTEPKTK